MKIFVPMSDAVLGVNGEVCQSLIPFDLSFLGSTQESGEGKKPHNWYPILIGIKRSSGYPLFKYRLTVSGLGLYGPNACL